jgi:thiamine biosynthesis lipoprotein
MTLVAEAVSRLFRARQGHMALLLFVALFGLLACQQPPQLYQFSGPTMGTTWSVKTMGLPDGASREQIQSDIGLILETVNNQMSTYQADSSISRFNQGEADSWHALQPDFFRVLEYALSLAEQTGGAYDPTVGPLVNLWGFGPDAGPEALPSAEDIAAAAGQTGWQKLELDAGRRAVKQPGGLYLDLSSVAKGFAVDKIADYLITRGVDSFLVEVGGELRGQGSKPGGRPWRIAIEQPLRGVRRPDKVVALNDQAIATSGDYRNFRRVNGELYSHTIDPRTGRPVAHQLALVSVLADSCMQADALATALEVLGPQAGLAFARDRELAVRMMVRTDEGFEEIVTSGFQRYMTEVTPQ